MDRRTQDRVCYFGDVMHGKMILSGIGIIADVLLYKIKNHANGIELGEFVVMPNHVHGILILKGHEPNDTYKINFGGGGSGILPMPS